VPAKQNRTGTPLDLFRNKKANEPEFIPHQPGLNFTDGKPTQSFISIFITIVRLKLYQIAQVFTG